MERRAAHELDIEGTLPDRAQRALADRSERLHEEIVEGLSPFVARPELCGLAAKRIVGQLLHGGLKSVDLGHQPSQRFDFLAFTGSEDAIEDSHAVVDPTGTP
ncbi:unannotated protein [freshwater metagenome]|uniref:Unannotated protein n=1 Tax=freshwater metagenome TaxID=449393 RepID=A0A6J6XJN2_9ZZZZ